jgi:hypothetical protein
MPRCFQCVNSSSQGVDVIVLFHVFDIIFQGSVTAMTVFFPLDTARLRLQGKLMVTP